MKILGENGIGKYLKQILQIGFVLGVVALVSLPFVLSIFGLRYTASAYVIYPNGIGLLVIMYQFIGQFDSLKKNEPFCIQNVRRLNICGIASLVEVLLWTIDLVYELVLAKLTDPLLILVLIFMIVLFLGVSIAFFILAELIRQATEYKTENELTI